MDNNRKNSRVLFRGIRLGGGSPKSAYQYLMVLKEQGCNISVIVAGHEKSLEKLYKESFDTVSLTNNTSELLDKKDFKGMLRQFQHEYNSLKEKKPDLVLILGHLNAFFYARFCNSLGIPAVTLIAGGDLSTGIELLEGCPCDHIVCFSEENRDVLLKCISDDRITVIPNRIKLKTVFDDAASHYSLEKEERINILFTSRLNNDKYDSLTSFIALADRVADNRRKINLAIAGDGDCADKLKDFIGRINNNYLNIELKGHIDNLIPEFEKAHIVVGKGRSVIEPIMMNRVGCIAGDGGEIRICTKDNFEEIYHYNFSGRNFAYDNSEEVLKNLIDSISSGLFDTEEMLAASDKTREYYSSEYLADKFNFVLDNMKCERQRNKRVSVLGLVLKLVWIKLCNKIRKGIYGLYSLK